ncbi:MAG: polyketide synthase dehydratase domain-containing protein [Thiolinea sp.]
MPRVIPQVRDAWPPDWTRRGSNNRAPAGIGVCRSGWGSAGINGPDAVTLSAELADLQRLKRPCSRIMCSCRILDLNYAFHSHWMDPIRAELLQALEGLQPEGADQKRGVRFVSTVRGKALAGTALGAEYWWDNIRQPVAFAPALEQLIEDGVTVFLEVGPHAILRSYVNECLRARGQEGRILTTGRRGQEQAQVLEQAVWSTWLAGCQLDWHRHFPVPGHFFHLPNYPWQREHYWYPLTSEGYDLVNRRREHPLLGYRLKDAEATWENQLDTALLPWLADHVVDGAVVVPGAAYVEMALAAASLWRGIERPLLENFEIRAPVMLDDGQAKTVRLRLDVSDGRFEIVSRARLSEDNWAINVTGRLPGMSATSESTIAVDLDEIKAGAAEVLAAAEHYALTEQVGLHYGPAFQTVQQVWAGEGQALAQLVLPAALEIDRDAYWLHRPCWIAVFRCWLMCSVRICGLANWLR